MIRYEVVSDSFEGRSSVECQGDSAASLTGGR